MAEDKHFLLHCSPPRWPEGGREREEGNFPFARQDWAADVCRGLHSRKFSFWRSAGVLLSLSKQGLKERLQTVTITLKWLFRDKRSEFFYLFAVIPEVSCSSGERCRPLAVASLCLFKPCPLADCPISPLPHILHFPSFCTERNEPSRELSCFYNKYSCRRWSSKGQCHCWVRNRSEVTQRVWVSSGG